MTKSVANTIVQTDTFAGWIDRTNELATEVRNSIVTTANSANVQFSGANTAGNGFVVGVFGANTFAMLTDGNDDAFIRAIQNGETDSANSSGNIVFQSVTNFNANVFANNITVDIEGNVVSNGTNFSITTSQDLDVTSSNVVISATEGMSIATPDLVVSGNNVDLNSTYANVSGTDLYVTSNVFVEAANLTIGNGAVSTDTSVDTATLSVSANATFSGANVYANGTEFKVASNTVINGTVADVNANVDIDNANTNINATTFFLGGTTANLNSTTVFVSGTTTNVSSNVNILGGTLYASANVEVEAANVTIGNTTSTGIVNVATQDFNVSSNVDITGSNLNVSAVADFSANVIVNSNDFFVDTSNQRVGVGTDSPSTIVHVTGPGAQTVTFEGGSANVLIVANSQSNFYGSQNVVIKTAGSKHIKLHANGSTAAAYTAMLAANGNFGIGNTAPAEKLVVAGQVRATANVTLQDELTVNNAITANTLTLTSNATLVDVTAEDITANTITLTSNVTLQDSMSVNNAISANTLTVSGTIDHANVVILQSDTTTLDANTDTQEAIVTFAVATYHSARITVTGRHTNSSVSEVQMTEVLAVTDGTDVFMTTFGTLSTDVSNDFSVFTIDADVDSGNVRILANTSHSNTTITATSQLFKI